MQASRDLSVEVRVILPHAVVLKFQFFMSPPVVVPGSEGLRAAPLDPLQGVAGSFCLRPTCLRPAGSAFQGIPGRFQGQVGE